MSYNKVAVRASVIKTTSIKSHHNKAKKGDIIQCTLIAYSKAKYRVGGGKRKFLSCRS